MAVAPQTALVDEGCRKCAHRPLEGAAGAGLVERLFVFATGHQVVHPGADVGGIASCKVELCREDATAVFFENAVAVSEVELFCRYLNGLPFCGQIPHGDQHVLHLAAVSSGVHVDSTAHRTRDTVGKLKTGEAVFQRRHAERREHLICTDNDSIVSQGRIFARETDVFKNTDRALHGRYIDDSSPVARILKQDVAAVAQQIIFDVRFLRQLDGGAELRLIFRQDKDICRAADAESAVRAERLVFFVCNARSGQSLFQSFHSFSLYR